MKFLKNYRKIAGLIVFITMMMGEAMAAQSTQEEKVESMRVAFITHRLNLTPEESKAFWPIYHQYRRELGALRRNFYPKDDGSDPHLDADRQLEFEQRKLDVKKRYSNQFEEVLGDAKHNLLIAAEEDFKKMLVQIVRNRKAQRPTSK